MGLRNRIFAIIFAVAVYLPAGVSAVEPGMTPSNVFGLWTNINRAIVDHARAELGDTEGFARVAAMTAKRFFGKRPSDVLIELEKVSALLSPLDVHRAPDNQTDYFANELIFVWRIKPAAATPSLVYLQSTHVLVDIVDAVMEKAPPPITIGGYFKPRVFEGKTSSDVFGLVDLARRRMAAIAERRDEIAAKPNRAAK